MVLFDQQWPQIVTTLRAGCKKDKKAKQFLLLGLCDRYASMMCVCAYGKMPRLSVFVVHAACHLLSNITTLYVKLQLDPGAKCVFHG